MASFLRRALFASAALALLCAVAAQPPAKEGDWVTGRATFFSAPAEFKQARHSPSRSREAARRALRPCALVIATVRADACRFALQRQPQHEFGHLYSGACEYTNVPPGAGVQRTDADVAFPIDEVAALGENSPDFKQGPCGRCYEVRCRTGNVLWDYNCRTCTEQLGGTLLADVTPDWKDSQNRSFPGYPDARSPPYQGHAKMTYAQCWCVVLGILPLQHSSNEIEDRACPQGRVSAAHLCAHHRHLPMQPAAGAGRAQPGVLHHGAAH